MDTDDPGAIQCLIDTSAVILEGHMVYTRKEPTPECPSGWFHGTGYVNKDALYPHTRETSYLCRAIAERFSDDNVQVVIAPAVGGVILSQWTAQHLSEMNGHEVFGVYAEKSEGGDSFVIKRGYEKFIADKRVLVVEDVLTTGGSVKKVIKATREIGGNVVGVGALVNRGGVTPHNVGDVPKLAALVNVTLDMYPEETCPLCEQNVPVNTDVGKGREFLARQLQSEVQ